MKTQSTIKPYTKSKHQKQQNRKSLTQKYKEIKGEDFYIEAFDDLSDDDIRNSINGTQSFTTKKTNATKNITCDNAIEEISGGNMFGPVPFGWREVVPFHIMQFKGPIGKALKHFGARNFYLGDQINAWFDQNCFINKANSMPGEDAVAAGYNIKPKGGADSSLVSHLLDVFNSESFNLDETMREFDHHKRCFGASLMVPCFEEEVDMSLPFVDYAQLKGKTFLGWTVIEPYYLSPEFESGGRETNDPTYKFYLTPTYWVVYGSNDKTTAIKKIHRSWIFFRRNIITSKIYQPTYKWQGPSVPQMIIERLYSAEVCANESSMLLRSKRSFVMEADVRKMAANPEFAKKFLKNCSANSDNWGVRVVPRNSNARQMDSYLSECMPLTTAQYGILCAEVDIPAPKFMMAQLSGFANSGNYEIKLYASKEHNLQREELAPIVRQTIKILTACETGTAIDCDVIFNDVDIPTIVEQAEVMYEKARASKFTAEAEAVKKMAGVKSAESHKGYLEKEGLK